jgi:hypothetical protein
MTITFLQLAERVLEEEKRALLGWEIWQTAKNKRIDKLVEPKGKTPGSFLEALIDADMRDNPTSVFDSLGDRQKRYFLKNQMDNIRDKVRILEHVIYPIDLGIGAVDVVAIKDSVGIKLYYEEYATHVPKTHYPIRFEEVVPLSDDEYAELKQVYSIVEVSCRVRATTMVPSEAFAVI